MTKRPIVAFLYDFDKTLCTTDMEDYAFIPSLGYTPSEFLLVADPDVYKRTYYNRRSAEKEYVENDSLTLV